MVNGANGEADELPRIASGITGLDEVLCGGFVRNGIYIVQGPPGVGKTIFGNQVCYSCVATGGQALYVTLLSETYDRMLLNIRRMRFFNPDYISRSLNYISAFSVLEQEGLQGLLTLLRREIMARRPAILVIDGLVAAEQVAASNLALKKFVHELQTQAATSDCTMFLLTSAQDATVSPEHTMVDGMLELGEAQYAWRADRDLYVRKFRGSPYLRGRHALRISDDGITVFPRLEALLAAPSRPDSVPSGRVSTGVAGLDEMLGGGVPCASSTLLLGPTGSGKTAFGLQFLGMATAEEPGLLIGFYEGPEHILARARALAPKLVAGLEAGHVQMLWRPASEDYMDRIGLELLDNVRRRGVRRVLLDGLLGFQTLTPHRDRLPQFIRALSNELRALRITTFYTMEVAELVASVVRAPATSLTPIAENLVLLRYVELGARLRRLISVLKVRDSMFDPQLRGFDIGDGQIAIGGPFEGLEGLLTGFPHAVGEREEFPTPGEGNRGREEGRRGT